MPFYATRGTFRTRVRSFGSESAFRANKMMESMGELFRALHARPNQIAAAWQASIVELYKRIVLSTPVGETGRAQGGWRGPDFSVRGSVMTARITNSVSYIIFLEYGWSKQAPNGMVRINMFRMSREFRRRLRELLSR